MTNVILIGILFLFVFACAGNVARSIGAVRTHTHNVNAIIDECAR